MNQVQLEIPETLHRQLQERAQREGVSLQDYIVESLARVVTVPDLAEQRAAFESLLNRYPQEEAESALREILASRE
jgi:hypothetical protein